ncbi:MAG: hypothetical protein V2A73_13350 [Pseudomonadota bacterium]
MFLLPRSSDAASRIGWPGGAEERLEGDCDRASLETLHDLLVDPQSCETSAPCPNGSYCDPDKKVCTWRCYADSDCGPLATCNCYGLCEDGDTVSPPDGTDPSCPRETALLDAVKSEKQECTWLDDCPFGSRCDSATRYCTWDCRESAGCAEVGEGLVCDCAGRCVDPSKSAEADPAIPSTGDVALPRIELSPSEVLVLKKDDQPWWSSKRRIDIFLRTWSKEAIKKAKVGARADEVGISQPVVDAVVPDAGIADVPDAEVAIVHRHTVEVCCGSAIDCADDGGNWSTDCYIVFGDEKQSTRGFRAVGSFWMRPLPDSGSIGNWSASVTTDGVAATMPLQVKGVVVEQPAREIEPDGEYEGYVVLGKRTTTDAGDVILPEDELLRAPVRAWALGGSLDLYSDAGLLGASGKVRLVGDAEQPPTEWLPQSPESTSTLVAQPVWYYPDAVGLGTRKGQFDYLVADGTMLQWQYDLRRIGDLETCSVAADCTASGYDACDEGKCVLGGAWVAGTGTAEWLLDGRFFEWVVRYRNHARWTPESFVSSSELKSEEWKSSMAAWLTLYMKGDVYDRKTGYARVADPTLPSVVARDVLYNQAGQGYALCARDFGSYLVSLKAGKVFSAVQQFVDATITVDTAPATVAFKPAVGKHPCELLYPKVITTTSEVDLGIEVGLGIEARDYVPCIHPTPSPNLPAESLVAYTDDKLLSQLEGTVTSASCDAVRKNHQKASGESEDLPTFLANRCKATAYYLYLYAPPIWSTAIDVHPIYLCPFSPSLLGKFDAPKLVQGLLSYDPAVAGDLALQTSELGTSVLHFSGDLATKDGRAPRGVSLATYEDRVALSGTQALGSSELLAKCLEELNMPPPGKLPRIRSEAEGRAYYASFFGGTCFSPGVFDPAFSYLQSLVRISSGTDEWAGRLLHRLLQQWAMVHSFVAREGAAGERLRSVLASASAMTIDEQDALRRTPEPDDVLNTLEKGLNLVLAYRSILVMLPAEVLANPDYRSGVTARPDDEQPVGLPVALLETVSAHLTLLEQYLQRTLRETYASCTQGTTSARREEALGRLGRTLRYVAMASALASTLHDRAITATSWEWRWQIAKTEVKSRFDAAVTAGRKLARCVNPLGLSNRQTPLFFSDPTGDSGRFFAASDYLLSGWAKPAVEHAVSSLELARRAWLEQRSSRIQAELTDFDAERRVEQLGAQYGRLVVDACGLTEVEAKDVLGLFVGDDSGKLDEETCFMTLDVPSCREQAAPLEEPILSDEELKETLEYQQCVAVDCGFEHCTDYFDSAKCDALANVNDGVPPSEAFAIDYGLLAARQICEASKASCADIGSGERALSTEDVSVGGHMKAECYRGQLGEALLAIFSAGAAVRTASSAMGDAQEMYDLQFTHCVAKKEAAKYRVNIENAHQEHLKKLSAKRSWVLAALDVFSVGEQIAVAVATGGASLGSGQRHTETIEGDSDWVKAANIAKGLFLGPLDSLGMYATHLSKKMEDAQKAHEIEVLQWQLAEAVKDCFFEAEKLRVGIDTADLRIQEALLSAESARIRFLNLQRMVRNAVAEGSAAAAREQGRKITSIAHHYWLDDKINRFEKDFAWAQRLVYLAVQAVEYEFQQSLPLRQDIIAATNPDQLVDVVRLLEQEQLTRTINGRRPEEMSLVLSLRDDILMLASKENAEKGRRDWTPEVRFQHRMWDPAYAAYDNSGTYLGQGIPFVLSPTGALKRRCAERLWRVAATLQGDMLGVNAPTVPVFLMKRNSFASQWCDGRGEGMQSGAMQPTSQLFQTEDRGGVAAQSVSYVSAVLQPWLNVPRSELYREAYQEGASEELAGRGLYGDYLLVFPIDGLLETGFPLEQLEDVLLRVDFLSVDDIQINM